LSASKAALRSVEAITTNKQGRVHEKDPGVTGETWFVENLLDLITAKNPA
jgi:hypothetical protein